ncbi:unnamed protein product [Caenorhabditis bovis]|uniref:Transcription factor CBF/NF-Y/archaeal histone domain-containing protein n=1 Tax=Caenorhabditis bovis TaxID=2654633 RepID=A0A8S1F1P4_9PELO|nr:unnamed protein product [Caenorhabditis bovis]
MSIPTDMAKPDEIETQYQDLNNVKNVGPSDYQYGQYYQPDNEEDEEDDGELVENHGHNVGDVNYMDRSDQNLNGCFTRKDGVILDQERFLPIANISRIMKTQVDPQAKLSKEAKECVQECVSEFIQFLTSEAADYCHQTKRKTLTADDLLTALEATGFDNYAEPMRIFLMKYRQAHKLTGPIHRPHTNYVHPPQYANDPPIQPLFYKTDGGMRCVETQFFNSDGEEKEIGNQDIEENQESEKRRLSGQSTQPESEEYFNEDQTASQTAVQTEQGDIILDESGEMPIAALEQQHQMQIYVDASTKQHYAAMETPQGIQLFPITIQNDPITITNTAESETAEPATEFSSFGNDETQKTGETQPSEESALPLPKDFAVNSEYSTSVPQSFEKPMSIDNIDVTVGEVLMKRKRKIIPSFKGRRRPAPSSSHSQTRQPNTQIQYHIQPVQVVSPAPQQMPTLQPQTQQIPQSQPHLQAQSEFSTRSTRRSRR